MHLPAYVCLCQARIHATKATSCVCVCVCVCRLAAIEIFRTFTPHEQRSPWFAILRAVLTTLACSDVIAFWQLVRAAPFVLACVLYSQFSMVQGQGMALAAKAYGK